MSVPLNHDELGGPRVQFPVVIITDPSVPQREPMVVLGGGGPGNSLSLDEESVYYHRGLFWDEFVAHGRTLILMDQRGVGSALPSTTCEEIVEQLEHDLATVLGEAESWQKTLQTYSRCRERLTADGVDIRYFDTTQSSRDVDALRRALDIDYWVLYGVSYGARLGLEIMRRYPETVSAAILDSPAPPQFYYYEEGVALVDDAISRFFSECASDEVCARRYPNLERHTLELLEQLAQRPQAVAVMHPYRHGLYHFVMDRKRLVDVMFDALYDLIGVAELPAALAASDEQDLSALAPFITTYLKFQFDTEYGDGLSMATDCREEVANTRQANVPDYVERYSGRSSMFLYQQAALLCDALDVGAEPASTKLPVQSDIPTLVLSGLKDPITPPKVVRSLMPHLSNGTFVSLREDAHFVFYNHCARQLSANWLDPDLQPFPERCIHSRAAELHTVINPDVAPD